MKSVYSEVLRSVQGRPYLRRSVIAPNRLETRYRDFLAAIPRSASSHSLRELRDALRCMTGREHIFFASSCRAAIAQVLSFLPHKEVVLPAYTCPVVKTAIQIAGRPIVYVDVAKNGINATSVEFTEQAKPGRVLIPTHIFGVPTDIEAICDLARAQDCVTIEDAAAAFGARRDGRMLGTYGDVGVISFERSKRLPAFRGAAIIINNEKLIDPAKFPSSRLVETKRRMPIRELVFAMFYGAATSPWIYGRATLPFILRRYRSLENSPVPDGLEAEKNSPFYVRDFHAYQAALILAMLKRFDHVRARIADLVSTYRQSLAGSGVMTFVPPKCDDAGLLRFPVAFPGRERSEMLRLSLNRGLFLETNYERPLPEEQDWARFPNAAWAARNLVLLPLYARLSPDEAERIAKEIVKF
jgi:dTDP-4-amino-4,6-dideoxygalactose transaminase